MNQMEYQTKLVKKDFKIAGTGNKFFFLIEKKTVCEFIFFCKKLTNTPILKF
jgi:hypothetical protein